MVLLNIMMLLCDINTMTLLYSLVQSTTVIWHKSPSLHPTMTWEPTSVTATWDALGVVNTEAQGATRCVDKDGNLITTHVTLALVQHLFWRAPLVCWRVLGCCHGDQAPAGDDKQDEWWHGWLVTVSSGDKYLLFTKWHDDDVNLIMILMMIPTVSTRKLK